MSAIEIHQLEKLRPLGRLEQWSTARHHLSFYKNVGVSVSYETLVDTPVRSLVFSVLSTVISQHSILSAIPVDEDTQSPYFARLPQINLDRSVTFISRQEVFNGSACDRELDELLQVQHNKDFKDDYGLLPFWRLVIITNPTPGPGMEFIASFIFHHALGDGMSGLAFHDAFLSALMGVEGDPTANAIIPTPKSPLSVELDRLHSMPLPPAPPTSSPGGDRPGLWTGGFIRVPLVSRFRSLAISKGTTVSLVKACREHETTITAALQVMIAVALFQSIPEEKTELDCSVPVSLRRWLPGIDSTSIGNYLDGMMETYQRRDLREFSWDEARRSRETVQKYLAGGGEFLNVARIKLVPNLLEMLSSQLGKERNFGFDVSNLGLLSDPTKGQEHIWRRGRTVFSRSASAIQIALPVSVVTGGDGCLTLGFVWQEGVVEESLVMAVVKRIEIEIETLARN